MAKEGDGRWKNSSGQKGRMESGKCEGRMKKCKCEMENVGWKTGEGMGMIC